MRPAHGPVLDMRMTGSGLGLQEVRHRRAFILAACAGLAVGVVLAGLLELRLQALRDEGRVIRAQLQSLREAERQLQTQLQALRDTLAQRQRQQAHQDHWLLAGQSLRLLGRLEALVPSAQLTQVRWDAQGLTATGQVAPSELHAWLDRLSQQTIGLGVRSWLEIGGAGSDPPDPLGLQAQASPTPLRFVVRHGLRASVREIQR